MQRHGLIEGDAQLLCFYSDAFFFRRHDGNGITDAGVFSYWYDRQQDKLFTDTIAYENIEDISVQYARTNNENTVINIFFRIHGGIRLGEMMKFNRLLLIEAFRQIDSVQNLLIKLSHQSHPITSSTTTPIPSSESAHPFSNHHATELFDKKKIGAVSVSTSQPE